MGTTQDVKERLPGLQFRVEKSIKGRHTFGGTQHGRVELLCEFRDPKLFEAAVEKLNGFKLFGELAEEIVDALGAELDSTVQTLAQVQQEVVELKQANVEKDAEIIRLRELLRSIEIDLDDARGESVFNDKD